MAYAEPTPFASDDFVGYCDVDTVDDCTVVSLFGEHDCATALALVQTFAAIARSADGGVIVDLSGVSFMSAATVRVLDQAQAMFTDRSRAMVLRHPSPSARRLLDLCSITYLTASPGPADAVISIGSAGL